jgi:hypothetical protein
MPKERLYHRYCQPYGRGTGRLYPCKFKIIEVTKDGSSTFKDIAYGPDFDPEYVVKKLKEFRKMREEEDFHWFDSTTLQICGGGRTWRKWDSSLYCWDGKVGRTETNINPGMP